MATSSRPDPPQPTAHTSTMVKIVADDVERAPGTGMIVPGGGAEDGDDDDDASPIEEVRMTVPPTDDLTLPVWTFRMWTLGLLSCVLMSFLNQFFSYRTEPLMIGQMEVKLLVWPLGHLLARVLPRRTLRPVRGVEFSLNPGPFTVKEHVIICIFANAGFAFGGGNAYAVAVVDIVRVFYHRSFPFLAAWLLVVTTLVNAWICSC